MCVCVCVCVCMCVYVCVCVPPGPGIKVLKIYVEGYEPFFRGVCVCVGS